MANANMKLIFIGTPPSDVQLSNHRRQLAVALRKVGNASPFVNAKMVSPISLQLQNSKTTSCCVMESQKVRVVCVNCYIIIGEFI
jgi:hypothetical protein